MPVIRRAIAEMYGEELKADCFGTSKCPVYKKSKKCKACPRGKDAPKVVDPVYEQAALDHIHTLAIERECGQVRKPEDLYPLEWQLLLGWHAADRAYERMYLGQLGSVGGLIATMTTNGKR